MQPRARTPGDFDQPKASHLRIQKGPLFCREHLGNPRQTYLLGMGLWVVLFKAPILAGPTSSWITAGNAVPTWLRETTQALWLLSSAKSLKMMLCHLRASEIVMISRYDAKTLALTSAERFQSMCFIRVCFFISYSDI